jgi:hypothetical protein
LDDDRGKGAGNSSLRSRLMSRLGLTPRDGIGLLQWSSTTGSRMPASRCQLERAAPCVSSQTWMTRTSVVTVGRSIPRKCSTAFLDATHSSITPLPTINHFFSCPFLPPILYFPTSRTEPVEWGRLGCWLRQGRAVGQGKTTQKCSFGYSRWVSTQTSTLIALDPANPGDDRISSC